jgi:amidase
LLDRTGPMARNVTDVALTLHGIGGMDAGDLLTAASLGHFPAEGYLSYLKKDALKHARIGILRENFGSDADGIEGRAVADAAIAELKKAGAILIDPLPVGLDLFTVLKDVSTSSAERREAMRSYLVSRGNGTTVKSLDEIIASGQALGKLKKGLDRAAAAPAMYANEDYNSFARNRAALQQMVLDLFERYDLDAIAYPYQTILEHTIEEAAPKAGAVEGAANYDKLGRGTRVSTATGFPGLTVPAGFTDSDGMPIGLEFLGKPWTEGPLLGLGYAFEQATKHRKLPATTPALPGEWIEFTR